MGIVFILLGIYINETMLPVGVKTKDEKVTFSTEKWYRDTKYLTDPL